MDLFSNKHREGIEKEIKQFLPGKLTDEWVAAAIGKGRWSYDENALTKAVSEPVWELLNRGGKRWRPMLMLICCEAVGGNPESIMPFTVIPELIHNGTLIVDDIEDDSDLRRGKPALHKLFGVDIAVNAGNTIYFLPYTAIQNSGLPLETKRKAYELISAQLLKCHLGQAIDIWWHSGNSEKIPTEEEYLQMCANKTGSLACMAAKLGALLGGGTEKQTEALGQFAESAGVAFQVQDDILNISESRSIGKGFGDDIKEGKRTLMVIHALNVAASNDKKRLLEILNIHTKDEELLAEAISILNKYSSIAYAEKIAREITQEAWREVDFVLPESQAKKQLLELAELMVSRKV